MNKSIIVYTTKTCAFCKDVKRFLGMKKREYKEYDVTDDVEMRKKLYEKTGYTTVPVVQCGDTYIVGPQYGKIAQAIS